jgi:HlyD family secretion protein
VEASFVLWQSDNVLQVPASALFRHQEGWAVFAVEQGSAKQRPVQVGHRNGLVAEILSGLAEGEQVISHPDDTVREGAAVKPRG